MRNILNRVETFTTFDALDNVSSGYDPGCDVPSVGASLASCYSWITRLYHDVIVRLYSRVSGKVPCVQQGTALRGSSTVIGSVGDGLGKRRFQPSGYSEVFEAYLALCSSGASSRRLRSLSQITPLFNSNLIHSDFSSLRGPSASLSARSFHANTNVVIITGQRTRRRVLTSGSIADTNSVASPGEPPKFLQLYIYDTNNEVQNRMHHFRGIDNSQLFRTVRDKYRELDISEFKIRLYNAEGARGYELPTSNALGAMVFENESAGLHKKKQNDIQSDYLLRLYDAISRGERDGYEVGGRIILPMSFTGSLIHIKRFMSEDPHLTDSDRVDIVCRVFEQKIQVLITFLKEERIFGEVTRVLYTVEFQKRGLPHYHSLLWVDSASEIRITKDIDRFISAELPYPRKDPEGYNIALELMMHGPCGAVSLKAPFMKGEKCIKKFPKKFNQKTFFDENGHVHYRRRDASVSATRNEFQLNNSYFFDNRYLLLAFRAHINVEYGGWSMLIKYLFKYISKGTYIVFTRVARPIGESSTAATPS
nr:DNA helicase [Tanacetum cinerariifolium]